jgi:uncharacterized protein (DUF433 family)
MKRNADSVIVQDPEVLSGEPVFRGTRVPFQALLDYLEAGDTLGQFLEQFPGVSRADAVAALEEAKALVLARFSK